MPAKSNEISTPHHRGEIDRSELLNNFTSFYDIQAQSFPELAQLKGYVDFENIVESILGELIEHSYDNALTFYEPSKLLQYFIRHSIASIYTSGKIDEEEERASEEEELILKALNNDESKFTCVPRPIFHLTEHLSNQLVLIYITAQNCEYNQRLYLDQIGIAPAFKRRFIK